jgi:hypothetical protein
LAAPAALHTPQKTYLFVSLEHDKFKWEQESGRFLKKAAQKLLLNWASIDETSTAQFKKVFCFFFSKKKPSAPLFSGILASRPVCPYVGR